MPGDTLGRVDGTSEGKLLDVSDAVCEGYRLGDLLRVSDGEREEDVLGWMLGNALGTIDGNPV